jgi:hypothetical protein
MYTGIFLVFTTADLKNGKLDQDIHQMLNIIF